MKKKQLVSRVTELLRENDIKKSVRVPKYVLHVSDNEGGHRDFEVPQKNKRVSFSPEDVEAIFEMCLYAIEEALRNGEDVVFRGFGAFVLKYRQPTRLKNVLDGKSFDVEGHYVPKFVCGNDLRRCAQMYEQSIKDKDIRAPKTINLEEEEDDYTDGED